MSAVLAATAGCTVVACPRTWGRLRHCLLMVTWTLNCYYYYYYYYYMSQAVRDVLSSTANISLEDKVWSQASLPVRWGGIGVRDVETLAPSAYLGSYFSTTSQILAILPPFHSTGQVDPLPQEAVISWQGLGGTSPPQGEDTRKQRVWDDVVCNAKSELLLSRADQQSRARLRAVASPDAGVWLHTLPYRNLGLCLSDRE